MKLQHLFPALALLAFLATPVTAAAQLNCGDILVLAKSNGSGSNLVVFKIDPATGDRTVISGFAPTLATVIGSGDFLTGASITDVGAITVVANCGFPVAALSRPGTALGVLLLGFMAIYWHRRRSVLPGLH